MLLTLPLAAALAAGGDGPIHLAPPRKLTADGVAIDTGKDIAHSGPLVGDFDGDGVHDLLVGNFRGHIDLYRNAGTAADPKYTAAGQLKAAGEVVEINNW